MKKRRRGSQEDTSQHLKREDNGILCTENCARINLQRTAYSTASSIQSRVIKQGHSLGHLGETKTKATVKELPQVSYTPWCFTPGCAAKDQVHRCKERRVRILDDQSKHRQENTKSIYEKKSMHSITKSGGFDLPST
ncbi:hypothetical protein OS493_038713 [Desmophyllum pertusum]|uniref:Uncharacterized protein n=1 Tax=Desmophyllum pertusum TaxID=174260 RepID=A0A9W9Z5V7_9CNID|nr:hypothetical protein OS493_038713 [Desmophyllum pertusum]